MSEAKKILVVEDDLVTQRVLSANLKKNGYDVITTEDGQEGLNLAREEKPNLIILDVMLPKLNGYKICKMLKFDEKYKHIPIIMFTSRAEDSDKKTGMETGADTYINKPLDAKVLMAKIEELLKRD